MSTIDYRAVNMGWRQGQTNEIITKLKGEYRDCRKSPVTILETGVHVFMQDTHTTLCAHNLIAVSIPIQFIESS